MNKASKTKPAREPMTLDKAVAGTRFGTVTNPGTTSGMLARRAPPPISTAVDVWADTTKPAPPPPLAAARVQAAEHGTPVDVADKGQEMSIALDLLDPSPYQLRLMVDETRVESYAESLKTAGQVEPILVRPKTDGRFEIISGHTRHAAAQMAGLASLRAEVRSMSDEQAAESVAVALMVKADLSDYERALGFKRLTDQNPSRRVEDLVAMLSLSRSRFYQILSILNLPPVFLNLLDKHPKLFNFRTAEDIRKVLKQHPDKEAQIILEVEQLIDRLDDEGAPLPLVSLFTAIENAIQKESARVRVRQTAKTLPTKRTFTDKNGLPVANATFKPTGIELKFAPGANIDHELAQKIMLEALHRVVLEAAVSNQDDRASTPAADS